MECNTHHRQTHHRQTHHRQGDTRNPGFLVVAPCRYDAVGGALRDAFRGDRSLPAEIAAALRKLDRVD